MLRLGVAFVAASALAMGCAPRAMPLAPDHPAHPEAAPGRLAGPPPALRPGVVTIDEPAAAPETPAPEAAPSHEGHH